jgi:hypothetical protein
LTRRKQNFERHQLPKQRPTCARSLSGSGSTGCHYSWLIQINHSRYVWQNPLECQSLMARFTA